MSFGCCRSDAKKCGQIVAIIGIILSSGVLLIIPLSILLLYAFIFAFVGIKKGRHGYLTAAKILLTINIVIDSLITLLCVYFAIAMPRDLFDNLSDYEDNKTSMRIVYSVGSVVLLSIIAFLSFAFIIFHRAQHIIQNPRRCSIFPVTNLANTSNAAPIYISSSSYNVTDAPPYSIAVASGYELNPPSYSQAYNGTQELPSKSHDMNAIPFQPTNIQLDSKNS
uniref:Uncharacterized protein n=1 Tax=Panagrolaimus sp. PS1159 TaxID=55785 RepID=A0AC35G1U9_9BILA